MTKNPIKSLRNDKNMNSMNKEQKELLIKDLCARLPYGVKCVYYDNCAHEQYDGTITGIQNDTYFVIDGVCIDVENVKPYLFPLSSMTEEQRQEFLSVAGYERKEEDCGRHTETYYYDMVGHEHNFYPNSDAIDWLNKNHFDYRGLIHMGLAIDATNLKIY